MAVLRFRTRPWHREDHADLQRRPVPRAQPRRDARYDTRTGGGAPDVAHGRENLGGQIGFLGIAAAVERTLEQLPGGNLDSLEDVYDLDKAARATAAQIVAKRAAARQA